MQNAHYATALERGRTAAGAATDALDGVMAVVTPVIECNRVQVDNGRTYLREMVFGDATEPHHATALSIVGETEGVIADVLIRHAGLVADEASVLARAISAVLFVTMAASVNADASIPDIVLAIRAQVAAILPR